MKERVTKKNTKEKKYNFLVEGEERGDESAIQLNNNSN